MPHSPSEPPASDLEYNAVADLTLHLMAQHRVQRFWLCKVLQCSLAGLCTGWYQIHLAQETQVYCAVQLHPVKPKVECCFLLYHKKVPTIQWIHTNKRKFGKVFTNTCTITPPTANATSSTPVERGSPSQAWIRRRREEEDDSWVWP